MAELFDQVISYYYFNILAVKLHYLRTYIHRKFTVPVRYRTITFAFYRPAAVEAEKKAFMSDVAKVSTLLI